MANSAFFAKLQRRSVWRELLPLLYDTVRSNRVRFFFVSLGMVVGTASLILVVAIGMTGKIYVVNQIRSIGANMIDAEYQGGGEDSSPDKLTIDDLNAIRQRVFGVVAASPVLQLDNRIPIGWGKDRQVRMLAVYPDYRSVRNLVLTSGRFFDWQDEDVHHKVGVMQHKLAQQLYGSVENASGKIIQLNGLPVTLIGTFQEKVDTFGQSEVTDNCILIPYSVGRYFTDTPEVEQLYFSVSDSSLLKPATQEIRSVIQSRHRPESNYIVQNLSSLIRVAEHSADALTLVLILITAVTLLVSGIGIMNIMLVTVKSRVFEIGIRKAVGATDDDIRLQFLSESVLISLIGGIGGVVLGLAIPLSIRFLTPYQIPISGLSAAIAVIASAAVGVAFGTMPAARAARLDPVICLRSD